MLKEDDIEKKSILYKTNGNQMNGNQIWHIKKLKNDEIKK
jgi:hypothetical protein